MSVEATNHIVYAYLSWQVQHGHPCIDIAESNMLLDHVYRRVPVIHRQNRGQSPSVRSVATLKANTIMLRAIS